MADLHTLAHYRAEARPLCQRLVAQALRALGGAAHPDLIVAALYASAPHATPKPLLAREVDRILRAHAGRGQAFVQVFGPDSRRWALNPLAVTAKPPAGRRRSTVHGSRPAPAVGPA